MKMAITANKMEITMSNLPREKTQTKNKNKTKPRNPLHHTARHSKNPCKLTSKKTIKTH